VLLRKGLEVELVRGVVVGGDGLGVRVHHDRLVAIFLQSEGGVAAAVVELDSLADAVRTGAQDHDARAVGLAAFALALVRRVVVRGIRFELRRAGVHEL